MSYDRDGPLAAVLSASACYAPVPVQVQVDELASVAAFLSALATASVYDDAHIHHSQGAPGKSDFASSASAAKTPPNRLQTRASQCVRPDAARWF
jgi:hypothetical protein